jgi:hypothetical protein
MAELQRKFEEDYLATVEAVLGHGKATALCTIYYGAFPDPFLQRITRVALTVFNDCIIQAAIAAGLPLLDLRLVCSEPGDYANEIEPSTQGGEKIARAIARLVTGHDFLRHSTTVYI